MPRPKSWVLRIAEILKDLESDHPAREYNRREVERLFGLGADQAIQIMEVAGYSQRPSKGVGGLVSRTALLFYVRNCREGQDAIREIARREKLAKTLKAADGDLKFRKVPLRVTRRDEWASFEELPNISIRPGLMQVSFTPGDPVDLLDSLFRFVKAAGNEYPAFEKMCIPANTAKPRPSRGSRWWETLLSQPVALVSEQREARTRSTALVPLRAA
jgi:hypothetical protein